MERHKRNPEDFTQERKLTFAHTVLVILRKSMRSLQCLLNETLSTHPSAAAFTNARKKLKHTAFIELNQRAVVETIYADTTHRTAYGFRLLAVDGSKVILPNTHETRTAFGTTPIENRQGYEGDFVCGMAPVLYDVENKVALDAHLAPSACSELSLMEHHLSHVGEGDLVIFDRGYCAYQTMDSVAHHKADFLIRCHARSFKIVDAMFRGEGDNDVTVTLPVPVPTNVKRRRIPHAHTCTVRFVRVTLTTGEIEVCATSLLDTERFPLRIFRDLYYRRWGIETFFSILKSRLDLEHFSGLSVESILQDFHAAVFLTGVESILTADTTRHLKKKRTKHPQQVNNAVAFHAIKHRAFELFMGTMSIEDVTKELEALFRTTPTLVRKEKCPPRTKPSSLRVLNYRKRVRKVVF